MGDDGGAESALAEVRRNGRRIIDSELARLLRRSPQLARQDVAAIDQALDRVLDRLIVERVRRVAGARPELLATAVGLFDPPGHLRGCRATGPMVWCGEERGTRPETEE
ncbi:hypothetical protein [Actinopolymorpha pittospori]